MKHSRCPHCDAPSKIDLETWSWQLQFLAHNAGQIPHDADLSEDHFCGMMSLLYELAEKIMPREKEEENQ